jgi:hypothetical protein
MIRIPVKGPELQGIDLDEPPDRGRLRVRIYSMLIEGAPPVPLSIG